MKQTLIRITLLVLALLLFNCLYATTIESLLNDPRYISMDNEEKLVILDRFFYAEVTTDARWGRLDTKGKEQVYQKFKYLHYTLPIQESIMKKQKEVDDELARQKLIAENVAKFNDNINKVLLRDIQFLIIVFFYLLFRWLPTPSSKKQPTIEIAIGKAVKALNLTKIWTFLSWVYCFLWPIVIYNYYPEFYPDNSAILIINYVLGCVYLYAFIVAFRSRKLSIKKVHTNLLYLSLIPISLSTLSILIMLILVKSFDNQMVWASGMFINIGTGAGLFVMVSTLQNLSAYFYIGRVNTEMLSGLDLMWLRKYNRTLNKIEERSGMIKDQITNHKVIIISITAIYLILCGVSDGEFDYGFYTLLRFIVTLCSLYTAYVIFKIYNNQWKTYIIYISIAILFNPIIKIELEQETWAIMDFVTAVIIVIPLFYKRFRDKDSA